MTTIPWKSAKHATADAAVVQVSRLELKHLRHVPGFMLAALRLRQSVLRSDGALGVSLVARPLERTFWTLSAWVDTDAIEMFTRSEAHRSVMKTYRSRMHGAHFHTWFPSDPTDRPSWTDAKTRLAQAEFSQTR